MPDTLQQIVERMVSAGEPEENIALVIQHYKAQSAGPASPEGQPLPKSSEPPGSGLNALVPPERRGEGLRGVLKLAKDNPGTAGAAVAGGLAAPFTGGMSLLPTMAAEAGVGAGGAAAGHAVKAAATGAMPSLSDVAGDVLSQGLIGAAGPVVGTGLRLAGRGLYRAAALPIAKFGKYGDLIEKGLEERVPVMRGKLGLGKAEDLAATAKATKAGALQAADQRVAFKARNIADTAAGPLSRKAGELKEAGLGDPMEAMNEKLDLFVANNPDGKLTPTALDKVKGTWDDNAGGAFQKLRSKQPLTPDEQYLVQMTRTSRDALNQAVPNYTGMNRDVMDAEGLRRMIDRRVNPSSSGGNQGLENALAMIGGLKARLMMLPQVLSVGGIAANEAGKVAGPSLPSLTRLALLNLLNTQQPK